MLLLRLGVGILMMKHGYDKLIGFTRPGTKVHELYGHGQYHVAGITGFCRILLFAVFNPWIIYTIGSNTFNNCNLCYGF